MKTAEQWIAEFAPRHEGPVNAPCLSLDDIRRIQTDAIEHWAGIATGRSQEVNPDSAGVLIDLAWDMMRDAARQSV